MLKGAKFIKKGGQGEVYLINKNNNNFVIKIINDILLGKNRELFENEVN